MKSLLLIACVGLALSTSISTSRAQSPSADEMQEMMARAQKYTTPGEHHENLKRFLGNWDAEIRITMPGAETPPGKGTMETRWLMDGRWLYSEINGPLMGMPARWVSMMGYDNMKQSYVATAVGNLDTAMNHSEGDMDPSGKALILYGTIDEYLTGEIGKMVKTVYRFVSDDEIVMEIHDLPIGEENTKVVEMRFTRARDGR